jgi:site-specific DNA recombinase
MKKISYSGYRFPPEVIHQSIWLQLRFTLTGERIRDKITASKKKGLWMGGQPSLGYDVKNRKLLVNEAEAATVRMIFHRYLELGSIRR